MRENYFISKAALPHPFSAFGIITSEHFGRTYFGFATLFFARYIKGEVVHYVLFKFSPPKISKTVKELKKSVFKYLLFPF